MIVRLTKMVVNNIPLKFSPFAVEIPDMEIGWDGGYYYMENQIKTLFNDELWDLDIDPETDVQTFEFDYDHEVTITCA